MSNSPENLQKIRESLKSLGLTKYEALVYIALLKTEGATATEIHEISGVPRASVYPVLDRLVQKNLVSVSHTTPKHFNATPPDEGIKNLLKVVEDDAEKARNALNMLYSQRKIPEKGRQEMIWSIYGEENIRSRLSELISHASEQVQIITSWSFLKNNLLEALYMTGKGVSAEIITNCWEEEMPPDVSVHIHQGLTISPIGKERDVGGIFIIDGIKVMLVMVPPHSDPTALYSESPGFVEFMTRYWSFVHGMLPSGSES